MAGTPKSRVFPFALVLLWLHIYTAWSLISYWRFRRKLRSIRWRIHVNGIRGKSTVTRYITAILREAGYHAFGKTTGSAARILLPNGSDGEVGRKGFANVNEQVRIMSAFSRQHAEVAVVECMAINPVYARWLERQVMDSHIGVITNVRYDHAEYLGETLPEIAHSLAQSMPENGIVITAEQEPQLLAILRQEARARNSQLLVAASAQVASSDLSGFSHFAIGENVAIGFCVAQLVGLQRQRALRAMQRATSDPGAFQTEKFLYQQRSIVWANLFAVNDRESFLSLCHLLFQQFTGYRRIVILNNRLDRPTRVKLFAELAVQLGFDRIISFGDYEEQLNEVISEQRERVLNLGNSTPHRESEGEVLLQQILASEASDDPILLIGTVNIHTQQAERLLHFFQTLHGPEHA
jgi:poly-gamma-glutamate synthase PgsB/CapB